MSKANILRRGMVPGALVHVMAAYGQAWKLHPPTSGAIHDSGITRRHHTRL